MGLSAAAVHAGIELPPSVPWCGRRRGCRHAHGVGVECSGVGGVGEQMGVDRFGIDARDGELGSVKFSSLRGVPVDSAQQEVLGWRRGLQFRFIKI